MKTIEFFGDCSKKFYKKISGGGVDLRHVPKLTGPENLTDFQFWFVSEFFFRYPSKYRNKTKNGICLRPWAKDQGITWVVVVLVLVVLHHLVHFLFKRNLSELKYPWLGIKPGSFRCTAKHLSTELLSHRYCLCENWYLYLAADLGPVLVDTCSCCPSPFGLFSLKNKFKWKFFLPSWKSNRGPLAPQPCTLPTVLWQHCYKM